MKKITTLESARAEIEIWKKEGLTIGLVPTMGYLHEGHKSLIRRARQENDRVVVSIFVNPIQFGPSEDFEKYPRDEEKDLASCKESGADLVFMPSTSEMYPSPNLNYVDVSSLGDTLCGAKRPGHFRGVCTVVSKLFNIFLPDRAYFGQKDAQQLAIIKRMVYDLNFNVKIVPCAIVREKDGLALSSRNTYLSESERKAALILSKSLSKAKALLENGEKDAYKVKKLLENSLSEEPLAKIDYAEVVDFETLKPVKTVDGKVLVAIAVYIGKTRLIDNFLFPEE